MVKYFMHLSDFVICSLHFMSNNGITLVDLRVMKLISDKMLDLVNEFGDTSIQLIKTCLD